MKIENSAGMVIEVADQQVAKLIDILYKMGACMIEECEVESDSVNAIVSFSNMYIQYDDNDEIVSVSIGKADDEKTVLTTWPDEIAELFDDDETINEVVQYLYENMSLTVECWYEGEQGEDRGREDDYFNGTGAWIGEEPSITKFEVDDILLEDGASVTIDITEYLDGQTVKDMGDEVRDYSEEEVIEKIGYIDPSDYDYDWER